MRTDDVARRLRRSQFNRNLGGGQEFQNQNPWAPITDVLNVGPPPDTQRNGPGVQGLPQAVGFDNNAPPHNISSNLHEPWASLLNGIYQKVDVQQTYGTVGTQAVLVRKAEGRIYLLIQNTSLANQLFVAFGYAPSIVAGGATGFLLAPNGGSIEPKCIPQQDIWLLGSAAGTQFVLAAATG
jgi:hypothetical protein